MDTEDGKKSQEELNCLLSMTNMPVAEQEVQYWDTFPAGEQTIIWKMVGDDELIQVPVEYKIEKYVVSQSLPANHCSDNSEQFVIEHDHGHYVNLENKAVDKTDSCSSDVDVEESDQQEILSNCVVPLPSKAPKNTKKANRKVKGTKRWQNKIKDDKTVKKKTTEKKSDLSGKALSSKIEIKYDELTKLEDNAEQVAERFKLGCECTTNCFDGFNPEKVFKHRLNIADLTKAEHDMYLMGLSHACMLNPEETRRKKERTRIRCLYVYHGKRVCLTAFLYLEHLTLYQMKRIRKHLQNHGVTAPIHGNHGRKPFNTFPLDIYQHATYFVQNFIEKHHIKNSSDASKNKGKTTIYRLPADFRRKTLHEEYKRYCQEFTPEAKIMQYTTFTKFIKEQFPNVRFCKIDKRVDEDLSDEKLRYGKKRCKSKVVKKSSEMTNINRGPQVSESPKGKESATNIQILPDAKNISGTRYVLTSSKGKLIETSSSSSFRNLVNGSHQVPPLIPLHSSYESSHIIPN